MNTPSLSNSVAICICTFRRAHLASTLSSLALLNIPTGTQVSIIVADNDEAPSAKPLIESMIRNYPYHINYLHAPSRNISIARNACLDAAESRFVAFLDDDELATPEWLAALIAQQCQNDADVVLGPVQSRYPPNSPDWLRREDFHSIKPVWVRGTIVTGYTSNALLVRNSISLRGLRFEVGLGRSGGEDTYFFSRIHQAGGRMDYAPNALVLEDVVPERLSFFWLIKRYFRSGQTHGTILLSDTRSALVPRLYNLIFAFAKSLFCITATIGNLFSSGHARRWFLRGTLHAGVIARLLGRSELSLYV
jgi:succinoglycan biosynthesis protein ExoM